MSLRRILLLVLVPMGGVLVSGTTHADPWTPTGDNALRHDVQVLADAGMISAPVTAWPIPWATVLADLSGASIPAGASPSVAGAFARVNARLQRVLQRSGPSFNARLAASSSPRRIRNFQATPREDGELQAGVSWMGERFAVRAQATAVADPEDDKTYRADGSFAAMVVGNQILSAGLQDRWWGPGWEGSLIYSSNARPMPSLSLERNVAKAFETKWLSWIGPWTYSLVYGFLDDDRVVHDARFLGFRVGFRPLNNLEFGVTRTAQWCGDDRPCDFDTFWDLVKGNDNRGDDGIDLDNEPGNQLAAVDIRWTSPFGEAPYSLYTQWAAEDEASGTPSRWVGLIGAEIWGYLDYRWRQGDWRLHIEATDSASEFYEDQIRFDYTYEHFIYQTGYRYRDKAIGHPMDNDGQMVSLGGSLIENANRSWDGLLRWTRVNRGGGPENFRHTVSEDELNIVDFSLSHSRRMEARGLDLGVWSIGAGYANRKNIVSDETHHDVRGYVEWKLDL